MSLGIIFAHYEIWKVMRRFTLSTLRDFGMGKEAIEHKISEESNYLVKKIRSYKGEPFDNTMIINAATANIIVSILLSNRFDYEDPTLLKLIKIVNESMHLIGTPMAMLYNAFPTVMSWCSTVHKTVMENVNELHAFIRETFTNQKNELDVNDQRNLIDSFLVKQKEVQKSYYIGFSCLLEALRRRGSTSVPVVQNTGVDMDIQGLFSLMDNLAINVQNIQDLVVQNNMLEPKIPIPELFFWR
ncbi:unnamed protein product [Ranitomeya imitator]|uniref:Uncharacterized protein n=1 Tax=Ranitomeya imitator TaxID=111125 RepID=A0ABN9L5G1_9NEOB|nr:unnamed protein product [Ranitomeya imitator]